MGPPGGGGGGAWVAPGARAVGLRDLPLSREDTPALSLPRDTARGAQRSQAEGLLHPLRPREGPRARADPARRADEGRAGSAARPADR